MVLQRVGRRPGRLCAPELVDQPVGRDDLVRAREQQGEQRALPRAAERERTASARRPRAVQGSGTPRLLSAGDAVTATLTALSEPQRGLSDASAQASRSRRSPRRRLGRRRTADAVSSPTEVQIGSEFVGYRIEELIGRGGMGVVYRAYDLRLKRTVALKLIAPELALDERFRARFARETELAMSLEHPNVVPIHDAGDVDGRLYLAMRLVDGTDLGTLLRAEGALEPARALAICRQVASALDAAHAQGPRAPRRQALQRAARRERARLPRRLRADATARRAGRLRQATVARVGTPAYLAPEQIEGEAGRRPRGRLLARLPALYECLTGDAAVPARLAARRSPGRISRRSRRAASSLDAELPEAVDGVIRTRSGEGARATAIRRAPR